VISFRLRSSKL